MTKVYGGWTVIEVTTKRCRVFGHRWTKPGVDGWRDCKREGCPSRVQYAKDDPDRG